MMIYNTGMKALVQSKSLVADSLYLLSLKPESPLHFKAGQFLIVELPAPEEGAKAPKGYYSIASAEQNGSELVLLVEHRENGGYVSKWMSERRAGDSLQIQGPLGKFGLKEGGQGPLAFLGFKAGLAPLKSMILSHLSSGNPREAWLFLGGEPLFDSEWKALQEKHPSFKYRPEPEPAQALAQALAGRQGLEIYLAGFTKEIEPLQARLLEAGFSKEAMHAEKFG
jgi:phenol hydroxylase P5 protein